MHADSLDIKHTTYLRGVSIILIVFCHIVAAYGYRYATPLGGIGVAIFLFLSGYGLNESYKKKGLSRFWVKKIFRVWLPYFIVISIAALTAFGSTSLKDFFLDLLLIKPSYWFVAFIFLQYIVFWTFSRLLRKRRILALCLFSLISFLLLREIEAEQAFSFTIGVLISTHKHKLLNTGSGTYLAFAIVLLVIGLAALALKQDSTIRSFRGTPIYNLVQLFIKVPIGLSLSIFFLVFKPLFKASSIIIFLGKISYELYLVHMKFIPLLNKSVTTLFVFLVLSLFVSYILYYFDSYIYNKVIKQQNLPL